MTKKKNEENALTVQNDFAVSSDLAAEFDGLGLGAGEEIDSMDILIPKLMLTQGLTKAVAKGKAKVGTYINSINLADMGDKVEALVIQSYKVWQVYKVVPKKADEYVETLDYYGNENLEYNYELDGVAYKRKQVLGFYCLLLDEIKQGLAFPYIIDFKGASKSAGRELTSYFAKLRSINLPSFAKVFTFGTELVEDEHTYYVKTVDIGRDITREELGAVKNWIGELKENKENIRVHDEEEAPVEGEVINATASGSKF
jgi:hypothetical protein